MRVGIYVTQSMNQPGKCNIDVLFSEIPVIDQMTKRVEGCPLPFSYGYFVACYIADCINNFIPARLGIDECFKEEIERLDKKRAVIGTNNCSIK